MSDKQVMPKCKHCHNEFEDHHKETGACLNRPYLDSSSPYAFHPHSRYMPDKQIVNDKWAEGLKSRGIQWMEFADRVIFSDPDEMSTVWPGSIVQRSHCVNDPKNKMFGYTTKRIAVFKPKVREYV